MLIIAITIISGSIVLSAGLARGENYLDGFAKGVSWQPVVPIKKVVFVEYDENSFLDDYAYLAAVPTSVFTDNGRLFSNPLLFYQNPLGSEFDDKKKTLNARIGINYFMEDWMSYCNGYLDQMTLINVPKNSIPHEWKAKEYTIVEGDDPYQIASKMALQEWSYSDNVVLAVIEEEFKEEKEEVFTNSINGVLSPSDVYHIPTFKLIQTNSLNPVYHEFNVASKYKYIKAETWWDGLLIGKTMIPTGDPDLQLYCRYDGKWMEAAAVSNWNIYSPAGHEYTHTYVYRPGPWRVGITDFPTESDAPRRQIAKGFLTIQGSLLSALRMPVVYHVDITMYPGVDIRIPDTPPFGCRNVSFTLRWNNPNIHLGFSLIGPSGESVFTSINESKTGSQKIQIYQLGECLPGENYSISVFALNSISKPVDFEIEYSWQQTIPKEKSDSLTSATEGAVLASILNTPLIYTSSSKISEATKDVLYKLGVKQVYIVDIGKRISHNVINVIKEKAAVKKHFTTLASIYSYIQNVTSRNDVIFSTLDPWTYWFKGELRPAGETKAALFLGPAAYIAAHHGSPVLIVDNHPELSSAVVWHNQFWRNYAAKRYEHIPSVADMVLTGRKIYRFLRAHGFDQIGRETIITIADQYDIGIPWDRVFVGEARSGRICGTPVDTAQWISRSVFYPALIFTNPGLSQNSVTLINGSISTRQGLLGMIKKPWFNTLSIQRQTQEENHQFPVLCSFVTHKYRFNERASKYYGSKYQCADGLIPGETSTMNPIDQGVNKKYHGKDGSFFPDLTESEIIPFYLHKGGYNTVFSTKLEAVTHNLNQGVILWIHSSHGIQNKGGSTLFWDPHTGFKKHRIAKIFAGAVKEENPWRGYDWLLGSTEEPDTMSMDMKGFIPFTNHESLLIPATGLDWVLARKPIREKINHILDIIRIIPFRFRVDNLYDGLTGTISYSKYPLALKTADEIEKQLENIHSVGFITSICQTSNTYLHLLLIRHGSVFQVQDPWPTSWYGAVWRQSIPRDIILGDTVGEAYVKGISHVGILYIGNNGGPPQWWWDTAENVVYFGDPDLRIYVPNTEYSDANNWDKPKSLGYNQDFSAGGHMPFGTTAYPHVETSGSLFEQYLWILIAIIVVLMLSIAVTVFKKTQRKKQ